MEAEETSGLAAGRTRSSNNARGRSRPHPPVAWDMTSTALGRTTDRISTQSTNLAMSTPTTICDHRAGSETNASSTRSRGRSRSRPDDATPRLLLLWARCCSHLRRRCCCWCSRRRRPWRLVCTSSARTVDHYLVTPDDTACAFSVASPSRCHRIQSRCHRRHRSLQGRLRHCAGASSGELSQRTQPPPSDAPPPPRSPPSPRPPPPSAAVRVASALNARFAAGRPTNLAEAGVVVHQFDNYESRHRIGARLLSECAR